MDSNFKTRLITALVALGIAVAVMFAFASIEERACADKCGARPHRMQGREYYCFCAEQVGDRPVWVLAE